MKSSDIRDGFERHPKLVGDKIQVGHPRPLSELRQFKTIVLLKLLMQLDNPLVKNTIANVLHKKSLQIVLEV